MDASNGGSGLEYPKTLAAAAKGIHGWTSSFPVTAP